MRSFIFSLILQFFNLEKSTEPTEKKGKIIILIDGLGYHELREAIDRGYCPFLSEMLGKSYRLKQFYCGPPSSTTASEAELFYGHHNNIPGFTWYDRSLKRFVRGNRGAGIDAFEKSYFKKTEFLAGGSCILGVFTGGATQLDVSGKILDHRNPLKFMRKLHILIFVLLNPIRFVYTLFLILKSILSSFVTLVRNKSRRRFRRVLSDAFTRIFLGNISTYIAELEIARETPILFIDYLLYDEFAHEYGLSRRTTLSSLKLINWYCKSLYKMAQKTKRLYDFIIISDHGQSRCQPFDGLMTGRLERLVEKGAGNGLKAVKTMGTVLDRNKVYLVPAGSTVQLYFSDTIDEPVTYPDIAARYPRLESTLLADRQIGWLLYRLNRHEQILKGKTGEAVFKDGAVIKVRGNVLGDLDLDPRTLDSLAHYAGFENNGDIVIYGNCLDGGKVIAFEDHRATHGGFIGDMTRPFVLTNNRRVLQQVSLDNRMDRLFAAIRSPE